MPKLTVIAGPNGSGKSTLISYLRSNGFDLGTYINADDIAAEHRLAGEAGSKKAQELAEDAREACLHATKDFTFETVMSHPSKTDFMARGVRQTIMWRFISFARSLLQSILAV